MMLEDVQSHFTLDRKYLETSGVLELFSKVLMSLYREAEKPDNPIEYVQRYGKHILLLLKIINRGYIGAYALMPLMLTTLKF